MLTKETIQKINEFVYKKPRNISEIAKYISVNWRTANRYVEKIEKDEGTVSVRVFRGGTPGALKIVFWNNLERLNASEAQERLLKQIEAGRRRVDFSPSEIFQFVDNDKKKIKVLKKEEYYSESHFKDFINEIKMAERQILFFSGNLTFSNYGHSGKKISDIIEQIGKRGVSSKIITRVEMAGIENVKNILSINKRIGKDEIEIRHCFQPLRVIIIDDKMAVLKEVLDPSNYSEGELKEKLYILYYIFDQEWIGWLQKVFWHFFRGSIDAKNRMEELNLIM